MGGVMRVTIEHREEGAGLSGSKKHYFVDCAIDFSEEEKAIIKSRGLYDHHFTIDGAEPPRTTGNFIGAGALKGFAPIIGLGGFIWGVFGGGSLAGLLVFGAIGMYIAGFFMDRKPVGEALSQTINVRRLINNPRFTVFAPDPAYAKGLEGQIREDLTNLKTLITESAEVRAKQTFEL